MLLLLDCIYKIASLNASVYNSISRSCKQLSFIAQVNKNAYMQMFLTRCYGIVVNNCRGGCSSYRFNCTSCKNKITTWRLPNKHIHSKNDEQLIIKDTSVWYYNDEIHRDGGPALITKENTSWYHHGKLHRGGGLPAVDDVEHKKWYTHGLLHREDDLPAVIDKGVEYYYIQGLLHRHGGLPTIVGKDTTSYHVMGKLHRDNDLPAMIDPVCTKWYCHGMLHRKNGPAILYSNGNEEYYIKGVHHRANDKPAVIFDNMRIWKLHGIEYRREGLAIKEYDDTLIGYSDDQCYFDFATSGHQLYKEIIPAPHNELKPLTCSDGTLRWYFEGRLHNDHGPAVVYPDGRTEYWKHDTQLDSVTMRPLEIIYDDDVVVPQQPI